MDMDLRQRLAAECAAQGAQGGEIAVPLESFFVGNDDPGSIGCNLGDEQPTIRVFDATLASLLEHPQVRGVWVRVCDADDENSWPYSDTVYVVSSLAQTEIESSLAHLLFSEVSEGWMYGKPASAPEPDAGFTPFSVWWD
jgi:hypothetical protein